MTIRTGKKKETFGRPFVLGGFALVPSSRAPGGDTDEVNAPPKREQESANVAVVRSVDQKSLNGTTETRREEADREAIGRGEDEGMIIGRESTPTP